MCWLVLLALLGPLVVTAKRYNICSEMVGADFFREFYWWRWDDPTHGTVEYVFNSDRQLMAAMYHIR